LNGEHRSDEDHRSGNDRRQTNGQTACSRGEEIMNHIPTATKFIYICLLLKELETGCFYISKNL